jgi:FAD/FMN-containing dehydrogenase
MGFCRMIISHAGDGNFHVVILFDPLNDEELREVRNLTDGMVNTALLMEGTCTGEHGIGVGKMKVNFLLLSTANHNSKLSHPLSLTSQRSMQ